MIACSSAQMLPILVIQGVMTVVIQVALFALFRGPW